MKTSAFKRREDRSLQHELNSLYFNAFHAKCHINVCNIYHHSTMAGVFLNPIKQPCLRINGSDARKNKGKVIEEIANAILFFKLCFSKHPDYLLNHNKSYFNLAKKVANEEVYICYSYKTGLYFYDKWLKTGDHTYDYDDRYVKVYYIGFCKAKDVDKTLYMLRPIYHRYKNARISILCDKLFEVLFRLPWCQNFNGKK